MTGYARLIRRFDKGRLYSHSVKLWKQLDKRYLSIGMINGKMNL